jgi:hypothetical protein
MYPGGGDRHEILSDALLCDRTYFVLQVTNYVACPWCLEAIYVKPAGFSEVDPVHPTSPLPPALLLVLRLQMSEYRQRMVQQAQCQFPARGHVVVAPSWYYLRRYTSCRQCVGVDYYTPHDDCTLR